MKSLPKICNIALACALSACAPKKLITETQPAPVDSPPISATTSTQPTPTHNISHWTLSGAMAAKKGKKGWTASINWMQNGPNNSQIRLFGPLGGGSIMIETNGNQTIYHDGPKVIKSTHPEEMLQKETGIRLPVKNLYYWVRGLPAPGEPQSAQYDAQHNLQSLNQHGYKINYSEYKMVDAHTLPGKIRLEGHGVLIKLVIKHWS